MINERMNKIIKILKDTKSSESFEFFEHPIKDNIGGKDIKGFGVYKDNDPKIGGHRYYLYIDLENNDLEKDPQKILTAIMLNPSKSLPDQGFDNTVLNVIRIAQETGFLAVEILNLFSYIEPEINDARKYFKQDTAFYNINEFNTNFVIKFLLLTNNPIMVAWGSNFTNSTRHKQVKSIMKFLADKDVYTFCNKNNKICKKLNDNYPKHPGRLNNFEQKCIEICHNGNLKLKKYNIKKELNATKWY